MIRFEQVTNNAGISYIGPSYGAYWGDVNGDKYPDLWMNHHNSHSSKLGSFPGTLYINQGNGTFVDRTSQVFQQKLRADAHGAAWADFDNDGDQDLLQLAGGGRGVGSGPNQMYINEGEKLQERAKQMGIDYPLLRGKGLLWFDFDQDGRLDLFVGGIARPDGQAPPTIFRQTEEGFEDSRSTTGLEITDTFFGFLSDLSGDGNLDLVFKAIPMAVYDITSTPFKKVTRKIISSPIWTEDIASGDFNGDLRPDLYLTRMRRSSDLAQDYSNIAKVAIASQKNQKGVRFNSGGDVVFDFEINSIPSLYPDIYIGAGGFHPNALRFTLSAKDPKVEGIFPHTAGVDRGIYIGYNSPQQRWQILVSSPDKIFLRTLIETSQPIVNLKAIGFNSRTILRDDQLLINSKNRITRKNRLVDRSKETGINSVSSAGRSVVSGDFDNDMDLDLYIVATGLAGNRPNILYENKGDGTFMVVHEAGGAEGTNLGVGDSVVTADYDLDGFLDLFITNGHGPKQLNKNAPHQLFRNQGNDNHWLEIDLEGVVSNRDGIGAQVFVTAGGVTQLREQSGGIHNAAQNHQRLHFGLADNTKVDEILIKWPSGNEQRIIDVPSNQLLHIIESSKSFEPDKPKPFDRVGFNLGVFSIIVVLMFGSMIFRHFLSKG